MVITGTNREGLQAALDAANEHLSGNLRFKDIDFVKTRKDGREVYKVTLTVNDSNEIGSRRSFDGRRIAAACWHAHGLFFDNLPAGTEIRTSRQGDCVMHAGDRWQDAEIGSRMYPLRASQACNCMDWNMGGVLPFPVNV